MSGPADLLVRVARDIYLRGLTPGTTGNLSIRDGDGNLLVTPTDSCLGYLDVDTLVAVDGSGQVIGDGVPSKEAGLHAVLYERPDVRAVVHLHSPWASALSCVEDDFQELARLTPYFAMKVRHLARVPYFRPGSPTGVELLRTHLAGGRAALLTNHGTIAGGATLLDALNVAEEIEHAARQWFATRGHPLRRLTDADLAELTPRSDRG